MLQNEKYIKLVSHLIKNGREIRKANLPRNVG
jgi:hypothetical protein